MTTVSVVIPTYNAQPVLERTLQSVLSQKGDFSIEVVIADDGSSDSTTTLAHQLGAHVLTSDRNRGGPNWGRNAGIQAAAGEWICLMDQDDTFMPGKLHLQLEAARRTRAAVVWSGYKLEDLARGDAKVRGPASGGVLHHGSNEIFLHYLRRDGTLSPYMSTIMFHRSLQHVRFEENFGVVDFDYMLCLLENQEAVCVCEPLAVRYVDGSNLSLKEHYRRISHYYSMMILEQYEQTYPREVAVARTRFNEARARYFYFVGNMKAARRYFLRSRLRAETALYLLTTFGGSKLVKRHLRVFN